MCFSYRIHHLLTGSCEVELAEKRESLTEKFWLILALVLLISLHKIFPKYFSTDSHHQWITPCQQRKKGTTEIIPPSKSAWGSNKTPKNIQGYSRAVQDKKDNDLSSTWQQRKIALTLLDNLTTLNHLTIIISCNWIVSLCTCKTTSCLVSPTFIQQLVKRYCKVNRTYTNIL